MTFPKVTPLSAGIAALLFLSGATASYLGLDALARPTGFSARVEAARAAQRSGQAKTGAGPRRFPDTVICRQATVPASLALSRRLADAAGRHSLAVSQLQVAPGTPEKALLGLAPIDVQLIATGSQVGAYGLIADFEQTSPAVLIDRLELRPKGGAMVLQLSGRAYCALPSR